jgi:hypothetical protein
MARSIRVSTTARLRLLQLVAEQGAFAAVPALVWATDSATGASDWMVGFYDRDRVPSDFVVDVDGIAIVIEPQWRAPLEGRLLDYTDGRFGVRST